MSADDSDPLDSDDFNYIDYINKKFPTEESLNHLDTFIVGITSQISTLDEELSKSIQSQTIAGEIAAKEIIEASNAIQELFDKITDIKSKASQSEHMVQEICSDIKKLDYAKNHLQISMTALKRIQMLINAIGQLQKLSDECNYREAALVLDAIKQIIQHFEKYQSIPIIIDIKERLDIIQDSLKIRVTKNFVELSHLVDTVADVSDITLSNITASKFNNDDQSINSSIVDSCLIVDALGKSFRQTILNNFIQQQLQSYETIFGSNNKSNFTLDLIERRFFWYKKLLKNLEIKIEKIFPKDWYILLRITIEFIERTKIHLLLLFNQLDSTNSLDVHLLLKALQCTIKFEQDMSIRFDIHNLFNNIDSKLDNKVDNKDNKIESMTDSNDTSDEDDKYFFQLAYNSINGSISNIYDKFLHCYVILERNNLSEMLDKLNNNEDITSNQSNNTTSSVYESAIQMFVFIKNSIKRCTALTTGYTFYELTKEFKDCMKQYIELLKSRCPIPTLVTSAGLMSSNSNNNLIYRLPSGNEVTICYLINTAEYCSEVLPQLEQLIKSKINKNLLDKIDFTIEIDLFSDLIAFTMKVLVSGITDRCENVFKSMSSIQWANVDKVGEESSYCHILHTILVECIPKIRDVLPASYFNNFCTKLSTDLLQRYHDIIVRQKRISEMGCQQLLLDTYNIKTLLLYLHNLSTSTTNSTTTANSNTISSSQIQIYSRIINTRTSHIEMILKLVTLPNELLVERFLNMWSDGTPADLQMIMTLKGIKKQEQFVYLEALGTNKNITVNTTTSSIGNSISSNVSDAMSGAVSGAVAAAFTTQASLSLASSTFTSTARSAVGNLKWVSNSNSNA